MKKSVIHFQKTLFFPILALFCFLLSTSISGEEKTNDSAEQDSLLTDSLNLPLDSLEIDSVSYTADSIRYAVQQEKIILSRNAELQYHASRITADSIIIDLKNEQAKAKGQAFLKDKDQNMLGQDIDFDLETEWGIVRMGASEFDKGYYYGDEIRKIAKETFDVDNGKFTTCDALHPHFYIKSRILRLYKDDKIVAKPIIFYVNHFPVMALPFGTFTIKRGRQSGILVPSPGWNETNGKYLENIAVYYAYKDYADVILALNYYEKTGWQATFSSDYIKRYILNGDFNATLQKNIIDPQRARYEWNIRSRHHHDLGNNTTFDANLNFVSSKEIWEGNEDIDERLAERITSSLSYQRPLFGRNLNVSAKYVDDLKNETKDITLPNASFSLPSKPIYELFVAEDDEIPEEAWWKNFSYSYSFRAVHTGDINDPDATFEEVIYQTKKDSSDQYLTQHNAGIKHSGGLRYSYKFKGWLNLSQSITANEAWFDRDKNEHKLVRGMDYYTNSSLNFNLYGLRKLRTPYLQAIRHIITPSLNFTYRPDYSENEKFYSFGGINLSSSDKQRNISFSLENKWQLKLRKTKDQKERKINDFFKITSRISYDMEKEKGYSDINHNIDLRPKKFQYKVMDIFFTPSFDLTQKTYELKIQDWNYQNWDLAIDNWNFNLNSGLNFSGKAGYVDYFPHPKNKFVTGNFFSADTLSIEQEGLITSLAQLDELEQEKKNWAIGFSHSYRVNKTQYEDNDYSSSVRTNISAKITRNWTIAYDNYIDLKEDEMVSHSFTITRELHCWKVFFRYTKQGDYWNYRFQLFNIKLPDALKFRTSDHKR